MTERRHPVWHPQADCGTAVQWQLSVPRTSPDNCGMSGNAVVVGFRARLCGGDEPHQVLLPVAPSLAVVTGSVKKNVNRKNK